jgi:hypothetical protein
MKKAKQLAVYIDCSGAFMMEQYNQMIVSRKIVFQSDENEEYVSHHPSLLLRFCKKNRHQKASYAEIKYIIKHYQQVILFGPGNENNDVAPLITTSRHRRNIQVEHIVTQPLTPLQIHHFALNYFKTTLK